MIIQPPVKIESLNDLTQGDILTIGGIDFPLSSMQIGSGETEESWEFDFSGFEVTGAAVRDFISLGRISRLVKATIEIHTGPTSRSING